MLEIKNLSVSYGAIEAVKDISLTVNDGEIVSLIGAGKTTTLHTITGLTPAQSGSVMFNGVDLLKTHSNKIVTLGMAHIPEGRHVFTRMSVQENLEMGAFSLKDRSHMTADLNMVFDYFPRLKERRNQLAGTLSGGEQQRIAIARAMLKNAPILILDEATAFADPDNEAKVQAAFAQLAKGKTVLMIAHRLSTVANADCIYVVRDGQIAESGTKDELCAQNGLFARMWQEYQASVQWKVAKEG